MSGEITPGENGTLSAEQALVRLRARLTELFRSWADPADPRDREDAASTIADELGITGPEALALCEAAGWPS